MLTLISKSSREYKLTWLGIILVVIIAGLVSAVVCLYLSAASFYSDFSKPFNNAALMVSIFSSCAALVVISSSLNLTLQYQEKTYRQWKVIGVRPEGILRVILLQLFIIISIGYVIGLGIVACSREFWVGLVTTTFAPGTSLSVSLRFETILSSYLFLVVLFLVCSIRKIFRISYSYPFETDFDASAKKKWKWLTCVCSLIAGISWTGIGVACRNSQDAFMVFCIFSPLVCAAVFTPYLDHVNRLVFGVLSKAIPEKSAVLSISKYVAKSSMMSHSGIVRVVEVGVIIIGGFYSILMMLEVYATQSALEIKSGFGLDVAHFILLLGGPVSFVIVGALVYVVMTSRDIQIDTALTFLMGFTLHELYRMATLKSFFLMLTACLVGIIGVVLTTSMCEILFEIGLYAALDVVPIILIPLVTGVLMSGTIMAAQRSEVHKGSEHMIMLLNSESYNGM